MKAVGAGLEDFVDWENPVPPLKEAQGARPVTLIISESVEESEEDMSSLAASFSTRMRKRVVSAQ